MAKLADAPDLGSGGQPWGFESLHAHHIENEDACNKHLFLYKNTSNTSKRIFMNQQRITTTQQIMENMKPTYLQRKEKCKISLVLYACTS